MSRHPGEEPMNSWQSNDGTHAFRHGLLGGHCILTGCANKHRANSREDAELRESQVSVQLTDETGALGMEWLSEADLELPRKEVLEEVLEAVLPELGAKVREVRAGL